MTVDAAAQQAVALEVARYAASSEAVKLAAEEAVAGMWATVDDFYNPVLVAALAEQAAGASVAAQQTILGATQEFVTSALAALTGGRRQPIPRVTLSPPRGDLPPQVYYTRPAEQYRRAVALGKSYEEAYDAALTRAATLVRTDVQLVERESQPRIMDALNVTTYRRVLRPELSKTGSCGLCIAAASQVYKTSELMPIHPPSCKCITLPIVGDNDPGFNLNREDLDALYRDAGSSKASDLRRTRYQVNQHGEHGPVLTKVGQHFRGPSEVRLEDDPERAARMLAKTLPVLESLQERAAAGEDVAGPLAYQRDLVARLRRIVG